LKLYKIKNKENKYCNGRKNVKFTDTGKLFRNFKEVDKFLNKLDSIPDDWVLIECELVPHHIKGYHINSGEEYDHRKLFEFHENNIEQTMKEDD
jgi:hypothetical protein